MTVHFNSPQGKLPSLEDLLGQFLQQPPALSSTEGVEPYQVSTSFVRDPQATWQGALTAVDLLLAPDASRAPIPSGWSMLLQQSVHLPALPMAVGHFPQLVRDHQPLLQVSRLAELQPDVNSVIGLETQGLTLEHPDPQVVQLLQAGMARLGGRFAEAEAVLAGLPAELAAVVANEQAAVQWLAGDTHGALTRWQALPESIPVRWNRALGLLFGDQAHAAVSMFRGLQLELGEANPWFHLTGLYAALAEMHASR